jgi:hypothetical protein
MTRSEIEWTDLKHKRQGRLYDGHVLDMLELGITDYISLADVKGPKKMLGAKPCFLFMGEEWDRDPDYGRLRNLLVGTSTQEVLLTGRDTYSAMCRDRYFRCERC